MPVITPSGTGGGGSSTSAVQLATVTLSSADILASFVTWPVMVAAPGAGRAIVLLGAFISMHAGATPYDGQGGYLAFCFNDGLDNVGAFPSSIIQAATDKVTPITATDLWTWHVTSGSLPDTPAQGENQALQLRSIDFPPINGDGDATVSVLYAVATL